MRGNRSADCPANQIIYGRARVISRRFRSQTGIFLCACPTPAHDRSHNFQSRLFKKTKSPPDMQGGLKRRPFQHIHHVSPPPPPPPPLLATGFHSRGAGGSMGRPGATLLQGPLVSLTKSCLNKPVGTCLQRAKRSPPGFPQRRMVLNLSAQ